MGIKFLHLNIEGRKHIEPITKFLESNEIEVCCFQEIDEETTKLFCNKFGFQCVYVDMGLVKSLNRTQGIAILSKLPIVSTEEKFLIRIPSDYQYGYENFKVLMATIEKSGESYKIITVHLPVHRPGHIISPFQLETYAELKKVLDDIDSFLLTGDFNAPRGTVIFDELAKKYKDNMPMDLTSSLDPILHKAAPLEYVVDGIFTTSSYMVSDVKIHNGISDHKGVSGILSKI